MPRLLIPAALVVAATGVCLLRGLVGGPDLPACQLSGAGLEQTASLPGGLGLIKPEMTINLQTKGTLKTGDAAPALTVDKWVQGDAVKGFEKGRAYVVEFWATWCHPCRDSIPHLDKLSKKYKDNLTVIGVASSENAHGGKDNRLEQVQSFVKDNSATMTYTVAFDGDNTMNRDWTRAAGLNFIPVAFVINPEGKITWIGNPLDSKFQGEVTKVVDAAKASAKKS